MFPLGFFPRSRGWEGVSIPESKFSLRCCLSSSCFKPQNSLDAVWKAVPMVKRPQSALPLCCTIDMAVTMRLLSWTARVADRGAPTSHGSTVTAIQRSRSHTPLLCHLVVCCNPMVSSSIYEHWDARRGVWLRLLCCGTCYCTGILRACMQVNITLLKRKCVTICGAVLREGRYQCFHTANGLQNRLWSQ